MDRYHDVRSDPSAVQELVLSPIEAMLDNDYDLVDPNNPFVFVLESIAYTASANIVETESLIRKAFPSLSNGVEDLYHHMSDVDYLNRFSTPAEATFKLSLSLDEVKRRAIRLDQTVSKMTIPRDTSFTVDGYEFTLTYPIDIRVFSHGGVQIVYDVSQPNPIHTLESNSLDWQTVRFATEGPLGSGKSLLLDIPAKQYKITPYYDQLNVSTGFNKAYNFEDEFYYIRVWLRDGENEWREIKTTHSDQIYDTEQVTATITVLDDSVQVGIPQIYFSMGKVGSNVRVDVYTTKGKINLNLEGYSPDDYQVEWEDLSYKESETNEPIRIFSDKSMFSISHVVGGTNSLKYKELRDRVINDSLGTKNYPITENNLRSAVERYDYKVVKLIDNLTDRIYLASKQIGLDIPSDNFSSPVGTLVKLLQTSFDQLTGRRTVRDNGQRMTLESGTLFELQGDDTLRIVDDSILNQIDGMSKENKVNYFTTNNFFTTPFYYVLDATNQRFDLKAYHLDKPIINTKEFVAENQSAGLQLTTIRYGIDKTKDGFKLVLVTQLSEIAELLNDEDFTIILGFKISGESEPAVLKGTILGRDDDGNLITEFDIDTNIDIDDKDRLISNSFKLYDDNEWTLGIPLSSHFDIYYMVSNYTVQGIGKNQIDDEIPNFIKPVDGYSVSQERLNITMGKRLDNLWTKSRTIASPMDYVRHEIDVPNVYEEDVYETDEFGAYVITFDETAQAYTRNKIHNAGDPLLDLSGNQTYKHRAGDVVMDNGQPVIKQGRRSLRQIDLFLLEGIFNIVDDSNIVDYIENVVNTVSVEITEEMNEIVKLRQQGTEFWYYPRSTMGNVEVLINNNAFSNMSAEQSLNVKYYLNEVGYRDMELRNTLEDLAIKTILEHLSKRTISTNAIASDIMLESGDNVLDVKVGNLGGSVNYDLVTVKDEDVNITIKKRAHVLPNDVITISDAITFEWVEHGQ